MSYQHTQYGRFHWALYSLAACELVFAWFVRDHRSACLFMLAVGGLFSTIALCIHYLTVQDEGDHLAVRFGPLPALKRRIPFSAMTDVEAGRTSLIDGWGIHYIPGRGSTYNLWGFDCVKIRLGRRVVRVGSDDVDNLLAFVRSRIDA